VNNIGQEHLDPSAYALTEALPPSYQLSSINVRLLSHSLTAFVNCDGFAHEFEENSLPQFIFRQRSIGDQNF